MSHFTGTESDLVESFYSANPVVVKFPSKKGKAKQSVQSKAKPKKAVPGSSEESEEDEASGESSEASGAISPNPKAKPVQKKKKVDDSTSDLENSFAKMTLSSKSKPAAVDTRQKFSLKARN